MSKYFVTVAEDVGETGWITDKGEFIPCEAYAHEEVLRDMGLDVKKIELIWIRITLFMGRNNLQLAGDKVTKAQAKALEKWGIVKWGENKRLTASEKFIQMYCEA